jgi:hypothetical protein
MSAAHDEALAILGSARFGQRRRMGSVRRRARSSGEAHRGDAGKEEQGRGRHERERCLPPRRHERHFGRDGTSEARACLGGWRGTVLSELDGSFCLDELPNAVLAGQKVGFEVAP